MSTDSDPDEPLKQRLRQKAGLAQKAETGGEESTETEAEHGDKDGDGEDDEEDGDNMEMDMDADAYEAAEMLADMAKEDVEAEQVLEMLSPMLGGEDTRDDPNEMAADTGDEAAAEVDREAVVEEAREAAREAVADELDEKLDGLVDGLTDEVEATMQKANVARTARPTTGGTETDVSDADVLGAKHPAAADGGDSE